MAPDGGVLEDPMSDRVTAADARGVVDDGEGQPLLDVRASEVIGHALAPVAAPPLAVSPVGVGAVAAADVERHRPEHLHLDGQR